MSEMKDLNQDLMEQISGGAYQLVEHGRLSPKHTPFLALDMKNHKQRGYTIEKYLKGFESLKTTTCFKDETEYNEYIHAVKEYVLTFWDHV